MKSARAFLGIGNPKRSLFEVRNAPVELGRMIKNSPVLGVDDAGTVAYVLLQI